jgi:3-oxoacyl-[acyl-carrier-protein] synthase-3
VRRGISDCRAPENEHFRASGLDPETIIMNARLTDATEATVDPEQVRKALQPEPESLQKSNDEPKLLFRRSSRTNRITGVGIRAVGTYVPDHVVTNEELELRYGFEPGWVERRTGIQRRHYAAPFQGTSDLATAAARVAMERAGVTAADIDLLIVGTFTPDYTCPSTACLVQDQLGLDCPAMDLQAACSGFVYSLATASQFVATSNSKLALVIGADVNSRICEASDQRTAPLFGDAAGAVLLEAGGKDQGFLCYQLGADGAGGCLLDRPAGGSKNPLTVEAIAAGDHFLKMDGRSVFKWAIQAVTESIETVLQKSSLSVDDVSLFVLHQANSRIIDHAMKVLNIPSEKVLCNLNRYGNTSAASIPLVLDEAISNDRLKRDDLIMMCGFGGGLTWGTGLFRW